MIVILIMARCTNTSGHRDDVGIAAQLVVQYHAQVPVVEGDTLMS